MVLACLIGGGDMVKGTSLDMIIGSIYAHDTMAIRAMGEFIFGIDWTQPDHDNDTFTESDHLVRNPTIDSMLPAERGNAIFREVFGSRYRQKYKVDFRGGWDYEGKTAEYEEQVYRYLNRLKSLKSHEPIYWVCVFEYGTPQRADIAGRIPAEINLTEITYGVVKRDTNYYLGGIYRERKLAGVWTTLGNSWYDTTKSEKGGGHPKPYWFSAVNQYRDKARLSYPHSNMTYNEWNFEHGGADPHKQLLGITLWTLTPRDTEMLGLFNWWW